MASIPKVELDALTADQVNLYTSSGEIFTRFHHELRKSLFHAPYNLKLKSSTDNDDFIFQANNNLHLLAYTYMLQKLPQIQVKKEFEKKIRICWCHNVGSNYISDAKLEVDGDTINSFDHTWLDIHPQYFTKPGFRDYYNVGVGNVPYLEKWRTSLPSKMLRINLPWFYSYHTSQAFPIFRFPPQTKINHRMRLKRKITELLRMQISNDGQTWKSIKPSLKYVNCTSKKLPDPEMWGRYIYNTPEEIKWQLHCTSESDSKSDSKKDIDGKKVYYINDIIPIDSDNPATYGKSIGVSLTTQHMCKTVFFVAENVDSVGLNNLSNYTTN